MIKEKKDIGKVIKAARLDAHMTIEELADLIQVSSRYVAKIENEGNVLSYPVLKRLIRLLGIDANELFYEDYQIQNYNMSYIIHKLLDCDEHDLEVVKATLTALLKK